MYRNLCLLMFVVLCGTTQVASQNPLFSPAPGSPVVVGEGSGQVVLVDVNGDGQLDLVTRHLLQRVINVQLGDGTGRFVAAAGSPITLAYRPGDIKLADLNGDKIPDLGVSHSERDAVDIFFGDGKGGFKLAAGSPSTVSNDNSSFTRGLLFVDLNEDGILDIVTTNRNQNTFATLVSNGRGGFSPGPRTSFRADLEDYAFAIGDLDGDGHLDVVVASGERGSRSAPGRVVIQRGNGKGDFKETSAADLSIPLGARRVTLGDVNGDQRLDLIITHSNRLLSVMLNRGNGNFTPAPASPYSLETEAYDIAIADVNHDQKGDLIAATVQSVTILLGQNGGFTPSPGSPFRAGPGAYHLTLGDINKDGKLDIAAASFEGNAITLLLGR